MYNESKVTIMEKEMTRYQFAEGERRQFYQSKYEYYGTYHLWVIIIACLASVTYFISDCQLFGRFAWETLVPRTFILLPMIVYIMLHNKVKDYRIMIPFAYLIIHGIIWCTIWAIYYLPIKQHANEGFIIMHLLFFAVGLYSPFRFAVIAHSLVIVNIIVSNQFNHYESFGQMLMLGIPCVLGVCAINYVMEKVYLDHYCTKKEIEEAYQLDQLTKAYNRNVLSNIVDASGKKLLFNSEWKTAIVIADIDLFKRVNDEYGHPAGDKVLIYIAETIKKNIRSGDYLVRWGGEEFVLFLPDCNLTQAKEIAERIRSAIQYGENPVCPVTISAGICLYDGENYRTAISNADQALYVAKNTGRNKVICYGEELGVYYEGDDLVIEI